MRIYSGLNALHLWDVSRNVSSHFSSKFLFVFGVRPPYFPPITGFFPGNVQQLCSVMNPIEVIIIDQFDLLSVGETSFLWFPPVASTTMALFGEEIHLRKEVFWHKAFRSIHWNERWKTSTSPASLQYPTELRARGKQRRGRRNPRERDARRAKEVLIAEPGGPSSGTGGVFPWVNSNLKSYQPLLEYFANCYSIEIVSCPLFSTTKRILNLCCFSASNVYLKACDSFCLDCFVQ